MPTSLRVRAGGVTLAVVDHGSGGPASPALLFAHATGFCGAVWAPFVAAFRDRYRVITLDQRGHGDSDKPKDAYAWRFFVEDLAAVIDALELRDVIAVGHSKGGAAVAGVAADFPGRIGRAVLIDPVLIASRDESAPPPVQNPLAEGARRRRMVWANRAQLKESYARRMPFRSWRDDVLDAYLEHGTFIRPDGQVELKCPGEIEARVYEGAVFSGSLGNLSRIDVPVLLIAGGDSATLPPEAARQAASRLRHVRLEILPGVGHFVPMEAPDLVIELIDDFVSEEPSPRRRAVRG